MSEFDETIRIGGKSATIIRTPTNITTYIMNDVTGMLVGKRRPDPMTDYENGFILPSDCGVVNGDLLLADSKYYLVMSLQAEKPFGELSFYRGMLYECNSLVSIYSYSTTTKKHSVLVKADVSCLITQVRAQAMNDDKAMAIREYRGKIQPFQVFMQSSAGLTKDHIIVDQNNRRFRVAKDFDPFITENILQTQVLWEVL